MADSDYENDGARSAADRLIRDARYEVQLARNQMFDELASGEGVSYETRRQVAVATLKLWDTLYEERENTAVKERWQDSEAQRLEQMLGETAPIEESTPGRGGNRNGSEAPAVVAAPIEWLDTVSREVKDIANDLGKGPSVTSEPPKDEASLSDLRGLLKARGQKEALTHLPDRSNGDD